ncbi:MAG TPA: PAS domain S-box protein [Verrucomicrobiae bacterium]|nr:PAS domain S-box protein [Verrucomicrobiae bacterium]
MPVALSLFSPSRFMPHGFCYLWDPGLIWLHVVSDTLITVSYFSIPVTLIWFVRKRRDLPFSWMFALFGVFIVACGATHAMEVWNLWHGDYWLSGIIKAVTAAASVLTAVLLVRLVPQALDLPSSAQWIRANAALESEIRARKDIELDLRVRESAYKEQADMIDLIHDAVFVRGHDGRIQFWNRGAEALYGWSANQARGKVSHELLKTVFPVPVDEIMKTVTTGGYWEGELIHTRRDGSTCTVSSRWALRTSPSGDPLSVLESNRDITFRKQEELKFRGLLESAPDAIIITNSRGLIQMVNAQAEKLFGWVRSELVGKPIEVLVPARLRPQHVDNRTRYIAAPHARAMGVGLQLFAVRKDGSEFPVEISLGPLETREGTLVSTAVRDVTERLRVQKQLAEVNDTLELRVRERTRELAAAHEVIRHSHERLELAQKVASIGVFDYDLDSASGTWSQGMFEIYGIPFTSEKITREFWQSLMVRESMDVANGEFDKQAATTGNINIEFQIRRPDGELRWVASRGKLFPNSSGKLVRLVGVNADLTDTKLREIEARTMAAVLERRVEERTAELKLANKELESFSYSVSHDLRAPLRHMDGFARILKDEYAAQLPPEGLRYLDRIVRAANQMGRLVDDLLTLSRIGRKELSRRPVPLADIVAEVCRDLAADVVNRNIEWKIGTLPTADCDPGMLKIVFTNLVSNAVKFTRRRPIAVIEIGACIEAEQPAIFIRDNGVGFDSKYADKLFGVFQRLHREEEFEGTGVGLATVQRIIHRHGGEIRATSEPDVGTTFYFTLGADSLVKSLQDSPEVTVGRS